MHTVLNKGDKFTFNGSEMIMLSSSVVDAEIIVAPPVSKVSAPPKAKEPKENVARPTSAKPKKK